MDYEKIYTDFYSRNYNRFEEFIKRYWMKQKTERRTFGYAITQVKERIEIKFKNRYSFPVNSPLHDLYIYFQSRYREYDADYATQKILENEIKTDFNKIATSQFGVDYNYIKFIKHIALLDAEREISRLLSLNSHHLALFFDLNDFSEFEIRDHKRLAVEDYPIFKKLLLRKYPEIYFPILHIEKLTELDIIAHSEIEIHYNINNWNSSCFAFFKYLVENYEKNGKIKFVNIFYFLRDHCDKVSYSFRFTIDGYKSFIASSYKINLGSFKKAEFEFPDKEVPILKNFEQDFRRQVERIRFT